jgi:hypothetical protein
MKILPVYLLMTVLLQAKLFAQDTIRVFGGAYIAYKNDPGFIYLKPASSPDSGIIRLRRMESTIKAAPGKQLLLDSCYFEDGNTINCLTATGVTIQNSYCAKNLFIIGVRDTANSFSDIFLTIKSWVELKTVKLSNVHGGFPTLYGFSCDSLVMQKIYCSKLLLNATLIRSFFLFQFPEMNDNRLEIANSSLYGHDTIQTAGFNRCYIQHSDIESLTIRNLGNLAPAYFNAASTTFGSVTFQNPLLRVNCDGVYVKDFIKIDDSYIKLFLRDEDGELHKRNGKEGFGYFKSADYKTFISLSGLTMLEDSKLYLPPAITPAQLHLNATSLLNAYLYLTLDSSRLHQEYWDVQDYFFKTIQFYEDSTQLDESRKKDLIERLNYQKTLYKEKKISAEPFSFGQITRLIGMKLLKYTVNYGYHGEKAFAITLVIFILIWGLVYHIYFGEEVEKYLVSLNAESSFDNKALGEIKSEWKRFLMCCWFSFIVFANPKFPSSYFMFTRKLFKWLWREWLFGLVLFVLFIVYVASKYNFIQKMFGF